MKKQLKIGSVGKMFGISPQALRDYAKWNIVVPKRNDENNYRYYSVMEVAHLTKARYLKSMGFSIAEIQEQNLKSYQHGDEAYTSEMLGKSLSMNEWLVRLQGHRDMLAQEMNKIEQIYQKMEEYRQQIENISRYEGNYLIEYCPDFLFLELCNEENEIISDREELDEFQQWVDVFPSSRYGFICTRDSIGNNNAPAKSDLRRGLCIQEHDADQFQLQRSERTTYIPSQKCIHTIIGLDIPGPTSSNMLNDAADFARAHNSQITGDAVGMWLAHIKKEEDMAIKNYYDVWIPVK